MLCKKCENIIPDNETVCSYCGTSALDSKSETEDMKKNNIPYGNRKRNHKKNRKNNITHINDTTQSDENIDKQSLNTTGEESGDEIQNDLKPEIEVPKDVPLNKPEIVQPQPAQSPQPSQIPNYPEPPQIQTPITEPNTEIQNLAQPKKTVYIQNGGMQSVKLDSELPKADNKHILPNSSGIIYEIAEELYQKEKTASEIEALCQPPFKKIFSEKQLEQLNIQAQEKARTLVSSAVEPVESEIKRVPVKSESVAEQEKKEKRALSTGSAFLLQLLLFIPFINIVTALFLAFGKGSNVNLKAYSRAFVIWCVIFMTVALAYFSFYYFSNPTNSISVINLNQILR